MQKGTYRLVTIDNDGSVYESDPVDAESAFADLSATAVLHAFGKWKIEPCGCRQGFTATKNGMSRFLHLEPVVFEPNDEDLESLALAVGVLHPASRKDELQGVTF